MVWRSELSGSGGGTTDATARAQASDAASKIGKLYKVPGDSVPANSTAFILMSDGSIGQYTTGGSALTVPTTTTNANLVSAGFTKVATSTDPRLNKIYKTGGDSVEAGSEVFIILADGTAVNYKNPTTGALTVPATPDNTNVMAAGFTGIAAKEQHLHSVLASASTIPSSDTVFKVAGGKLWKNKKNNPDISLQTTDATWGDNWIEALSTGAGLTYVAVKDNDTLVAKQVSTAEPASNVVIHTTKPAAAKDSWFSVVNTGKGVIDVGGTQIIGEGSLEFTSNAAGNAWVLTSREGTVQPASEKTSKVFPKVGHGFKIGQPVYWDGSAFKLADSTTDATSDMVGVVSAVPDADNFELASEGYITGIVQTGLSAGVVFLNGTPGALTTTAPTTGFFKPVMILDSATSGWVIHRPGIDLSANPADTLLQDAWLDAANTNHATQGDISFRQVKDAILEEYKFYNTGTWDANDAYKSLNQFVAGSSGVTTSNFPQGLATPQSFISEYYGDATHGLHRIQIFGAPAVSRGIWSRQLSGANNWTPWQREGANNWQYTKDPAVTGDKITVGEGANIVCNKGDVLEFDIANSVMGCMVAPATDWADVPAFALTTAATAAGWSFVGTQPASGTEAIHLIPGTFDKTWNIKRSGDASASIGAILGVALADGDLGTFTGATIPDDATVKAALQALETKVESVELFGDFLGSFEFHADLPAAAPALANNFAVVDKDTQGSGTEPDPEFPAGIYAVDSAGTTWGLVKRITDFVTPGTLANITSADTVEHTWNGKIIQDAITAVDLANGYIARFNQSFPSAYGTGAGKARYAISADGKLYRAIISAVTGTGEPQSNTAEWVLASESGGAPDLQNGEVVQPGNLRYVQIAGVWTEIRYRGTSPHTVAADAMNADGTPGAGLQAEITTGPWAYVSQTRVPTVATASTWYIENFQVQSVESIYGKVGTESSLNTDISNTAKWQFIAGKPTTKPWRFVSSAVLTSSAVANPTLAEFVTWRAAQSPAILDEWVYYTGTTSSTDGATHIWYVDANGIANPAIQKTISVIAGWLANETVFPGVMRYSVLPDSVRVFLVSPVVSGTRKCGTTLDLAEMGKWFYAGQDYVPGFTANMTIPKGYQIAINNEIWQSKSTRTTGASLDATELGNWAQVTGLTISSTTVDTTITSSRFWSVTTLSGNPVTLTIAAAQTGVIYIRNSNGAIITINPPAGETIGASPSWVSETAAETLTLVKVGTNWQVSAQTALYRRLAVATGFTANGSLGTQVTTVDRYSHFSITQTTAGISITIPDLTNVNSRKEIFFELTSASTQSLSIAGAAAGSDSVLLNPGEIAYFTWTGNRWKLPKAGASGATLHDLGQSGVTPLSTVNNGNEAHFEGGPGFGINANNFKDGDVVYLLNTSGSDQAGKLTFSNFAGAYLRNGANESSIASPYTIKKGTKYIATVTVNGGSRYLNVVELGAAGGTAFLAARYKVYSNVGSDQSVANGANIEFNTAVIFENERGYVAANLVNGNRIVCPDAGVISISAFAYINTAGGRVAILHYDSAGTVKTTYAMVMAQPTAGAKGFAELSRITVAAGDRFGLVNSAGSAINVYRADNHTEIHINYEPSPAQTISDAHTLLTQRNITGSITSVGYDGVTLAYQIPLAPGFVLNTVSLNGTATTDFDANTGIVRITPNGSAVAVTHTTRAGATFSSRQVAGIRNFINENGGGANGLSMAAANSALDLGTVLQEGDKIQFDWRFNGNSAEDQSFDVIVRAGTTRRSHTWTDRTEYWAFPATLTSKVGYSAAAYTSAPSLLAVTIFRSAENKTVVPTATTVATAYTITVNGGANGTFTGHESIGPETFYLTNMQVNQEVDVFPTVAGVTLRNRQAGMFSVDRAVGGGNLALTGITFRNIGVKSKYFGTADNQAGHAADTNGGHTFTQRYMTGNGITTANGSTFTLSGGIYRVRYSVTHHKGSLAWSARALFVDGGEVCSIYTGDDGSNWPGGGDLEWIVDCTSASHTIQMKRTASTNNGNVDCWLAIEREEGYALPEGYQTREACNLTSVNGNFSNGTTSLSIPTDTGQWVSFQLGANQELKSCTGSAGLTVGTVDMKAGAAWVTVANGTTSGTLTVNIGAKNPAWLQTTANRGVPVVLGSLRFQLTPSGNVNFQIASDTGAAITAVVSTNAPGYLGSAPAGSGQTTLTLAAGGAFQSPRNYNFGSQGQVETFHIEDQTNSRRYFISCEVGAGFSGNSYMGFEI